jgi:nitrate/nitrite transporter NarK
VSDKLGSVGYADFWPSLICPALAIVLTSSVKADFLPSPDRLAVTLLATRYLCIFLRVSSGVAKAAVFGEVCEVFRIEGFQG